MQSQALFQRCLLLLWIIMPGPNVVFGDEIFTADALVGKNAGDRKQLIAGMNFRWCPPGSFKMGDAKRKKQADVTLTSGFWLGETEVTQVQWESLMKSTPWRGQEFVKEGADYAATYISHGDVDDGKLQHDSASEFCRRLTDAQRKAGRLPVGWKYALPTEAQWEYACRAGTTTDYSFEGGEKQLGDYAFSMKNGWLAGEQFAHLVGQKKENPWGFKDMHGNVSEWCADGNAGFKPPGGNDPLRAYEGTGRLNRGGSFNTLASECKSSASPASPPDFRSYEIGFRVALVASKEPTEK